MKQWTIDALRARRDALDSPARWCETLLQESATPVTARELASRCLMSPGETKAILDQLRTEGKARPLADGRLVHRQSIDQAAAKLLNALEAFHTAHPQRAGLTPEELYSAAGVAREVGEPAAETLLGAGKIERVGAVLARAGWKPRLTDREQGLNEQVDAAFQKAGWAGPAAAELAPSLRQPVERVERAIQALAERGILIRLDQRLFIHREALESAKQVVLRLFSKKPSFSTMEFRDTLGVSRKYAVPLLDYLDKIRFTVRSGHDRTPGMEARRATGKG
jgi:selenocysteine-specific elongation factor